MGEDVTNWHPRRWANEMRLRLLTSPRYWRWTGTFQVGAFRVRRLRYFWASDAREVRTGTSLLLRVLGRGIRVSFIAFLLVSGCQIAAEGLSHLPWHFALGHQNAANPPSYEPLFLAAIAVGATLLGLYFAAVSFVVSTRYVTVPSNVRELILKERTGAAYTQLVSILVAASVLLLAFGYEGYRPPLLTVAVVALLGVGSVIGFVSVGQRVFQLLSLEELAQPILLDLVGWTEQAIGPTMGKEFQDYQRRQVVEAIDTYEEVLALAAATSEPPRQLARLARGLIRLWRAYSYLKPRIKSDSWWFERQLVHPSWWLTDDTQVGLALNTGTGLRPKEEPDYSWVEKRLVDLLVPAVASLAEKGDVSALHDVAGSLAQAARPIAAALQIDDAIRALTIFSSQPALDSSRTPSDGLPSATTKRNAILDDMALLVANVVLGIQDAATRLGDDEIWKELDRALLTGSTKEGSPLGAALDLIQELRVRLDFEQRAERRRVTPSWWIRQQVAHRLFSTLDEALDKVLKTFDSEVISRAEAAVDAVDSVTLASRALEIENKLFTHLPAIEATLAKLEATRRVKDEWPTRVSADAADRTQALLERTIDVFVKCLPELAKVSAPEQPDFFGQAFFVLFNHCFAALLQDRDDRFIALFRPTLIGALTAHDRLWKAFDRPNADHESELIARSAPIEDIFELSGYALVCGELGRTGVWDGCLQAWNAWLTAMKDQEKALGLLLALVSYRDDIFAILPGDVIRTSRRREFTAYLSAKLGVDVWGGSEMLHVPGRGRPKPVHESPIVQVAAQPYGFFDPAALFIASYLATRLPPETKLPRKAKQMAESLGLRKRRSAEAADSDVTDDDLEDRDDDGDGDQGRARGGGVSDK